MRVPTWAKAMLLGTSWLGRPAASAQYSAPATPAPYNPIALADVTGAPRAAVQAKQNNYQNLPQNPYLGGIPRGKISATPIGLSLEGAVALGLKQNLGEAFATDSLMDARGQRWQALSELLPNIVTHTGFGIHQLNVKAAIGITVPNEPHVIGPFGYFDSRACFTDSVFDWSSIERARASNAELKVGGVQFQRCSRACRPCDCLELPAGCRRPVGG